MIPAGMSAGMLYVVARFEVSWALLKRRIEPGSQRDDLLPPLMVPSIAQGDSSDRDLAEIDQDGFAFALDERDTEFFNARTQLVPRRHHRLQIVLRENIVCVRKRSLPIQCETLWDYIREFLQWDFYIEAASLLRLRGLLFVPAIRRIDHQEGAIEMDYIFGKDLRHILGKGRSEIDYDEVSADFAALIKSADPAAAEIRDNMREILKFGVIPMDVTAASFIRGKVLGRLYVVDFNFVYLFPVPGWRKHAEKLAWLLGASP
jgi:hypothetical protein